MQGFFINKILFWNTQAVFSHFGYVRHRTVSQKLFGLRDYVKYLNFFFLIPSLPFFDIMSTPDSSTKLSDLISTNIKKYKITKIKFFLHKKINKMVANFRDCATSNTHITFMCEIAVYILSLSLCRSTYECLIMNTKDAHSCGCSRTNAIKF